MKIEIIEVRYAPRSYERSDEFQVHLRYATDKGCRIEKSQTDAWKKYIRENDIKEIAATSIGNMQFEKVTPVILNCGESWDGFYVYSKEAEAVLKYLLEPEE